MKLLIVGAVVSVALCMVVPVVAKPVQHSHPLTIHRDSTLPVLINQANLTQLRNLPGVGEKTAQKIIDYRNQHGSFKSIDELLKVKGINKNRVQSWGQQVTL